MVEVSGRITQVVNVDGKYPQLRIWIEGQDDPFCSTGSSRSLLPADIVDRLQRAETAVIAVEKEEVDSPRHNYAQGSSFREIRMLSPDGARAVTLEASSKQMSERHEFARLVAPAIAVFSAAWPASPAAAEEPRTRGSPRWASRTALPETEPGNVPKMDAAISWSACPSIPVPRRAVRSTSSASDA